MSINPPWVLSSLGKEAFNASRPFSFKLHPQVVFVNTGDVLHGKFLHSKISDCAGLPGQAKKALKENDILLTEIRPGNGRYAYVDFDVENYVVSTKFMVIESYGRVKPRFLYHTITNQAALDEFQRIAESRSGTFPQITFDSIEHFPVPVPPLLEQDALIEFFDQIDLRIALFLKENETLEEILKALFKSWFEDFDPVLAKSEGRLPNGVDEATMALFPHTFEESELGSIPRGWGIEPIGELLNRPRVSKRYTKNQVTDFGDYPVYEQGASILLGFHNEAPSCNASPEKPLFIFGDHTCITKISCEPFDISQNVILLEGSKRNSYWTYYAIQGKQHFEEYRRHWMELIVKKVVVPPFHICDAFAAISKPLQLKIEANAKRIYTLKNLRDTLLPRLISGQMRIANAGAELEKATTSL